ncbi:RNA-binding domain-containing protein [Caldivirga maquilingensis]|nr:RNA-binding domain-containing protein [Caldivirga maquilingensis]
MCLIDRIDVETHAHATEDYDKVITALTNLLGLTVIKLIETNSLRGHYNNPIKVFKLTLRLRNCSNDNLVKSIAAKLSDDDKRILRISLDSRINGNKLYLRFDKQRLYLNTVALSDSDDVVKVIIHVNPIKLRDSNMFNILRELGLLID